MATEQTPAPRETAGSERRRRAGRPLGGVRARRTWAVAAACVALVAPVTTGTALAAETPVAVPADIETTPVAHSGDSADDPAIWVDRHQPARSLVIGNDKRGALESYNLDGSRHQRITSDRRFWGNVDVRQGVRIGGRTLDLVAAVNSGLRLFVVDPQTRDLVQTSAGRAGRLGTGGGQGVCLYHSNQTDDVYAFIVNAKGRVRQFQVLGRHKDDLLHLKKVREFNVVAGTPAAEGTEACVADDQTGALYVSEEEVGLWRYGAEPGAGHGRTLVDRTGSAGHLVPDVEGLTTVTTPNGGYLIASAQNVASPNHSYFVVYRRLSNAYVDSFRIVRGAGADGCERTDGVAAYAGNLGPTFPQGIFVCQDNNNTAPGRGHQDFKFTRLEKVVDLGA